MWSNRRILSWFHPPLLLLFWVLIHIHRARGGAAQSGGKLRINFFCEFASWTETWAGVVWGVQFKTDNDISQVSIVGKRKLIESASRHFQWGKGDSGIAETTPNFRWQL